MKMKFQDWLKRQGEYISRTKLNRYVKNKDGEIYEAIREELASENPDVKFIPSAVYDQDFCKEK